MSRVAVISLHWSVMETRIRRVPVTAADAMTRPFARFPAEAAVAA